MRRLLIIPQPWGPRGSKPHPPPVATDAPRHTEPGSIRSLLAERGLNLDSIMAQALSDQLRQVERIDHMIASADARRNRVLAEVERRREAIARRLRAVSSDVMDIA